MKQTIYLAYGSNLNLKQMKERCPNAKIMGKALLNDYKLLFKGDVDNAYATIEPLKKSSVPVLLWYIDEDDEKSLDKYEVFPTLYIKEDLYLNFEGNKVKTMVYIMNPRPFALPSDVYFERIRQGYKDNDYDFTIIEKALEETKQNL